MAAAAGGSICSLFGCGYWSAGCAVVEAVWKGYRAFHWAAHTAWLLQGIANRSRSLMWRLHVRMCRPQHLDLPHGSGD